MKINLNIPTKNIPSSFKEISLLLEKKEGIQNIPILLEEVASKYQLHEQITDIKELVSDISMRINSLFIYYHSLSKTEYAVDTNLEIEFYFSFLSILNNLLFSASNINLKDLKDKLDYWYRETGRFCEEAEERFYIKMRKVVSKSVPYHTATEVVLVHLSDLHFGQDTKTILSKVRKIVRYLFHFYIHDDNLLKKLIGLLERKDPHILALTGDLTNWGDEKSLIGLSKKIGNMSFPRLEKVVVVPGNHDCLHGKFFKKNIWKNYFSCFANNFSKYLVDGCITKKEVPVSMLETPAHIFLFYLINSVRGQRWFLASGKVGEEQLTQLQLNIEKAKSKLNNHNKKRVHHIVLLHHHIYELLGVKNRWAMRCKDAPETFALFCSTDVGFVLHGHRHYQGRNQADTDYGPIYIASAGTACQKKNGGEEQAFNLFRFGEYKFIHEQWVYKDRKGIFEKEHSVPRRYF